MKNKNLLWLGLGAVALYLIFRKKPDSIQQEIETAKEPFTLPKITLPNNFKVKGNLPKIDPKQIKKGKVPQNPYLSKTCDELKQIRNNDMVSKIAPPTEMNALIAWELDKKYKEVAYSKCTFENIPPIVSVSNENLKLGDKGINIIDPLLLTP